MSDVLAVPVEAESMPAIETAAAIKTAAVVVGGLGFAMTRGLGFAVTFDPTGVATGLAAGITVIGYALINIAKAWDKSHSGKMRIALKASQAEIARLKTDGAEKEKQFAKQLADRDRIFDRVEKEVTRLDAENHVLRGQTKTSVHYHLVEDPKVGPPVAPESDREGLTS